MKATIDYLKELNRNNDRAWFHAHKEERMLATREFEELVQRLIYEIGNFDPDISHNTPKELTFKLTRDTRFSNDKSPYNASMRAHIGSKGKLPVPVGYYLMIKPNGQSFLGGGLFADMFSDATTMIRDYIAEYGAELEKIVSSPDFRRYFTVKGNALKNVPKGYDVKSPYADWLKYKSMYVEYALSDEDVLSDDFIPKTVEVFAAMKPFNDFLNRALKEFRMPQRP